jgi:hypothetical protein
VNEINDFVTICKPFVKEFFSFDKVKIKCPSKNEINIIFNKNEGIVLEKTKCENSLKVFLRKSMQSDLMLRSVVILYGNDIESDFFGKGFNKLYFDTEDELRGIVVFLRKKYDLFIKNYFIDDSIIININRYFEGLSDEMKKNKKIMTLDETQRKIIETMEFSKKVRFSLDGEIYLKS